MKEVVIAVTHQESLINLGTRSNPVLIETNNNADMSR